MGVGCAAGGGAGVALTSDGGTPTDGVEAATAGVALRIGPLGASTATIDPTVRMITITMAAIPARKVGGSEVTCSVAGEVRLARPGDGAAAGRVAGTGTAASTSLSLT